MKKLTWTMLLAIFIIITTVGLGIFLNNMLEKSANELRQSLDRTEVFIKYGNWSEAEKEVESMKRSWDEMQSKWTAAVEHVEVDEITLMLFRLGEYIKCEEKASSLAELASMREFILSVPDKDSFKLKNIL